MVFREWVLRTRNENCKSYASLSDHLCVDESISRSNGLGGDWIKMRLIHYNAYNRNTGIGYQLKLMACVDSVIMLRMKLDMGQGAVKCSSSVKNTVKSK